MPVRRASAARRGHRAQAGRPGRRAGAGRQRDDTAEPQVNAADGAREVVLALGSNLGDRLANLQAGIDALTAGPEITATPGFGPAAGLLARAGDGGVRRRGDLSLTAGPRAPANRSR